MRRGERRWAVVPAAGRGERFGGRLPKQYAPLGGRSVLSWTLAALLGEPSIHGVMVALAAGVLNTWSRFSIPAFTPVLLNVAIA